MAMRAGIVTVAQQDAIQKKNSLHSLIVGTSETNPVQQLHDRLEPVFEDDVAVGGEGPGDAGFAEL